MPVPIYLDHDSGNTALVRALRTAGVDVLTTEAAGNARIDDAEQLTFATNTGRILYSGNRGDFARLNAEWARSGRIHGGIVVRTRDRLPFGLVLDSLCGSAPARSPKTFATECSTSKLLASLR